MAKAVSVSSGTKIARWTVLGPTEHRKRKMVLWDMLCDCGNRRLVPLTRVLSGVSLSCGCLANERSKLVCSPNLLGKQFGRLTVIGDGHYKKGRYATWRCKCECGGTLDARGDRLIQGITWRCNWCDPDHKTGLKRKTYTSVSTSRRNSVENTLWRKTVLRRDHYRCVACNATKLNRGFIHVHHIESYKKVPSLRLDPNNGITLCRPCHVLLHSRFGQITTKSNLEDFLSNSYLRLDDAIIDVEPVGLR